MAKTKPYHLHKIKVHHNRWLLWTISYALMVTIAMWGYIEVSDIDFDTQLKAESEFNPYHTYNDNRLDFSIRYPADWSIEASDDTVNFIPQDSNEEGVAISRLALGAERSLRAAMQITHEKSVTIGGVKGVQITNDLGGGALERVVLVPNSGNLYVISGSPSFVNQILLTFKFLN